MRVYWSDVGAIKSIPLDGGSPTTLYGSPTTYTLQQIELAIDSAHIYCADPNAGLLSLPLGGGTAATLIKGEVTPFPIASDETSLYWTHGIGAEAFAGVVVAMRKTGGAPTTLASSQVFEPERIAPGSRGIFWTAGGYHRGYHWDAIMMVPRP